MTSTRASWSSSTALATWWLCARFWTVLSGTSFPEEAGLIAPSSSEERDRERDRGDQQEQRHRVAQQELAECSRRSRRSSPAPGCGAARDRSGRLSRRPGSGRCSPASGACLPLPPASGVGVSSVIRGEDRFRRRGQLRPAPSAGGAAPGAVGAPASHAARRKAMAFTKTTQGPASAFTFCSHTTSLAAFTKTKHHPNPHPALLLAASPPARQREPSRTPRAHVRQRRRGFLVGPHVPLKRSKTKCAHNVSSSPLCSSQPRSWLLRAPSASA